MAYDFDRIIDRSNTGSIKHDFAGRRIPETALSLWVADMDFAAPDCVVEALAERVGHGVYGYTEPDERYRQAVLGWMKRRFSWEAREDWLVLTPGVVFALSVAVRALTEPGDGVLIQQPVYYPFAEVTRENGRRLVVSDLVLRDGAYEVDWDDFQRKLSDERVKLFILCSPHNPVSRVWSEDELRRMGELCARHGVLVVSDEIHMDFVYPGRRHRVFADLSPELADNLVLCTAPSKTFNLAGLHCSNIFIPNKRIRKAFQQELNVVGYSQSNAMGLTACRAAYEGGAAWLDELLVYLRENTDLVRERLREIPGVELIEPQGTYLLWLDCRGLGMPGRELDRFLLEEAGLWLDGGEMFGPAGEGFTRVNIASPRAVIAEAMDRLARAVRARSKQ